MGNHSVTSIATAQLSNTRPLYPEYNSDLRNLNNLYRVFRLCLESLILNQIGKKQGDSLHSPHPKSYQLCLYTKSTPHPMMELHSKQGRMWRIKDNILLITELLSSHAKSAEVYDN